MDELEQERQRQLRLKALAEEGGAAIGTDEMRRASGLAPEQRIEADPGILNSLRDYAIPSANAQDLSREQIRKNMIEGGVRAFGAKPSPSPSPISNEDGLLDRLSAWASTLGKQTQAAPSPSPAPIDPNHPLFRMRKKSK